jgi:hypothetical protein
MKVAALPGKPPAVSTLLGNSSPWRWGFDTWAAIAGVAGCVVLVAACAVCLVSFAMPPPGIIVLGVVLSFVIGPLLSVLVALMFWVVLVPLYWSVRWLSWRLVGAAVPPQRR